MPAGPAVAVLAVRLEDAAGTVLHRNFATFVVGGAPAAEVALADGRRARLASVPARAVADARWSLKRWDVLGGRKVNGAAAASWSTASRGPPGSGPPTWPARRSSPSCRRSAVGQGPRHHRPAPAATTCAAAACRTREEPNAYPMTGAVKYPSAVTVRANGELAARVELADDPADSRGVLSWHAQPKGDPKNRRLQEAGSYGELVRVALPPAALARPRRPGRWWSARGGRGAARRARRLRPRVRPVPGSTRRCCSCSRRRRRRAPRAGDDGGARTTSR
jgi:hypothetical protein